MNTFDINRIPLKIQSPHVTTNSALHTTILLEVEKPGRLAQSASCYRNSNENRSSPSSRPREPRQ